jgi:hypothetical protein
VDGNEKSVFKPVGLLALGGGCFVRTAEAINIAENPYSDTMWAAITYYEDSAENGQQRLV